jgi:hypothetical protein
VCCSETLKGKDHSEDLGVDGRIILELTELVWTGFIWLMIRDQWRAVVNTVINFQV